MAEALFLEHGSELDVGSQQERRRALVCLAALLILLPWARHLASEVQLGRQLRDPRPSRQALRWGLRHHDPEHVQTALQAMEHLPLRAYGELLEELEPAPQSPLAALLPKILQRRGDRVSRRVLARFQAASDIDSQHR